MESIQTCPLDNPDMPVVPILDHRAHRCYCHHCICGRHKCPGFSIFNNSSPLWQTSYNSDFSMKTSKAAFPARPALPTPLLATPFFSNSTSHSAFTLKLAKKQRSFKPKYNPLKLSFTGSSSYQSEYIKWGNQKEICKDNKGLPYRGDMIKTATMMSSYREDFGKVKDLGVKFGRSNNEFGVKRVLEEDKWKVEQKNERWKWDTKSMQGSDTNLGVMRNSEIAMNVACPNDHFTTSYSTEFKKKNASFSLRRLRS